MPDYLGTIGPGKVHSEHIINLLAQNGKNGAIFKPATGHAGEGIFLVDRKDKQLFIRTKNESRVVKVLDLKSEYFIQELAQQHLIISKIYPHSVNTVRIVTLLTKDNDVIIVGAKMRFGNNGSVVDNSSQGGINVGINCSNGSLMNTGVDKSGRQYNIHPFTQVRFADVVIPMWDDVIDMAKRIQLGCSFYRLLGADIAISPDGPTLIELNANPDIVGLELAFGPILQDKSVHKAFSDYGLLINNKQKMLYVD